MKVIQFIRQLLHPLSGEQKTGIITDISNSARSCFDFFLLVVLSCSIATLGLITDSPAVIIGAMLVAPLMSPIIGIGLATITGNDKLARASSQALLLGAFLAILLSYIMTTINIHLPFVVIQELPAEVSARTHPSPIDLLIAMAGGLAAAYALTRPNISAALPGVAIATALMPPLCTVGIGLALGRWDVAGGATLLFLTNSVTIAFAAALVFFIQGFTPPSHFHDHKLPRSLVISAVITLILLAPLSYLSYRFFTEATENRKINQVVRQQVSAIHAELVELKTVRTDSIFDMVITVRTTSPLSYEQVVSLQKGIVEELNESVSLKVNQIFAEQLDPLIPPTPTLTPTQTVTNTPGPSPTSTHTPIPPTLTFTATVTASPTDTSTPTPAIVQVHKSTLPAMHLCQSPGGPVIGVIRSRQELMQLYGKEVVDGIIWVEVIDAEGRIGWIPEIYIGVVTLTPTQ